jgi:hypothetical protein
MSFKFWHLQVIIFILSLGLAFIIYDLSSKENFDESEIKDTVILDKKFIPSVIKEKKITVPDKVIIYSDTNFKDTSSNIIEVIQHNRKLEVVKFSTNNLIEKNIYSIPFLSSYKIDHFGNVQVKKKIGLKIGLGILSAGMVAALIAYKIRSPTKNKETNLIE